ncbi:MAG: NAD(P)-dependent oxidoreductase, partial [Chitinophagales bacterium]
MKTLIYSSHDYEKSFLKKAAIGKQELVFTAQSLDGDSASSAKGFTAVSLFTYDNASADVLKQLHANGVKYITLRSVGHDHVNLPMAKELGIHVSNVPAYSPFSIAEHAVALLMALNRKLISGQKLIHQNNFCLDSLIGFDLHGKTIGIVGTGKIGSAFGRIMKGFGCDLLGYDTIENKELVAQTGIKYTTLEDLCQHSDVVSIHCPLTNVNNHLFDKRIFSKMKKEAFLINTARGGIVNTLDLIDAIEHGVIAAAGLDVYENEKSLYFVNHHDKEIQDGTFIKLQ